MIYSHAGGVITSVVSLEIDCIQMTSEAASLESPGDGNTQMTNGLTVFVPVPVRLTARLGPGPSEFVFSSTWLIHYACVRDNADVCVRAVRVRVRVRALVRMLGDVYDHPQMRLRVRA